MKYTKTFYNTTCQDNLTFNQYYVDNQDSDEFYIDNLGETEYNCEECDNRRKALLNVRGICSNIKRSPCLTNNVCSSDTTDYSECEKCNGSCCKTNCIGYNSKEALMAKYKKIQKTVGVSSSEYAMNKSSLQVFKQGEKTSNNASDKLQSAVSKNTPRHSSSLLRTKFSLKPGAMSVGGVGVDAKHNSYARYLAKKKGGKALRAEQQTDNLNVRKQNIVMGYYINSSGCCYDKSLET